MFYFDHMFKLNVRVLSHRDFMLSFMDKKMLCTFLKKNRYSFKKRKSKTQKKTEHGKTWVEWAMSCDVRRILKWRWKQKKIERNNINHVMHMLRTFLSVRRICHCHFIPASDFESTQTIHYDSFTMYSLQIYFVISTRFMRRFSFVLSQFSAFHMERLVHVVRTRFLCSRIICFKQKSLGK